MYWKETWWHKCLGSLFQQHLKDAKKQSFLWSLRVNHTTEQFARETKLLRTSEVLPRNAQLILSRCKHVPAHWRPIILSMWQNHKFKVSTISSGAFSGPEGSERHLAEAKPCDPMTGQKPWAGDSLAAVGHSISGSGQLSFCWEDMKTVCGIPVNTVPKHCCCHC